MNEPAGIEPVTEEIPAVTVQAGLAAASAAPPGNGPVTVPGDEE